MTKSDGAGSDRNAGIVERQRAFSPRDLAIPVIQAPMAGSGITTPQLVAAVSNAGGLGSVAAAYCTLQQVEHDVAEVRKHTARPFAINLFAPTDDPPQPNDIAAEMGRVAAWHRLFKLPPPTLPATASEPFEAKMELIVSLRPEVVSFTFGILPERVIATLKGLRIFVLGTATTVEEARRLAAAGCDAVIAQGAEAGGHRGGFAGVRGSGLVGTMALVPQIADATAIPVVASGGMMDGRGIAAALALGAVAVQMGTAFLTTRESGAPRCYKDAVLAANDESTVITSAFSGRPARGIANQFTEEARREHATPLAYPWQNALTRPLRKAGIAAGNPEVLSLWAGQGAALARDRTVGELMSELQSGLQEAVARIASHGKSAPRQIDPIR